tara:strand:+ start:164 stop:1501 length:1338 start_codon:yes stop_codon:yes gene_type:complete
MARNRVIYQSEAVYVTQSGYNGDLTATSGYQGAGVVLGAVAAGAGDAVMDLHRVQSANYSFTIARQDVNQFGELAAIDRIITETPTVSFDTSYILANLDNENKLGFEVAPSGSEANTSFVSCISGLIDSSTNAHQKDYFILTSKEGSDAVDNLNTGKYESIIGIGNGFLTSYSSEASVGGLPTVSIGVEGMNMNYNTVATGDQISTVTGPAGGGKGFRINPDSSVLSGISGISPAIDPTNGTSVNKYAVLPIATQNASGAGGGLISALRPGDITLSLVAHDATANLDDIMNTSETSPDLLVGADIKDSHIQSYTLSFDLGRTPIQKLGTRFAFARPVDFPITASLSIDAVLADLTTGTISDLINCDTAFDAVIKMKDPSLCNVAAADRSVAVAYLMRDLKINSESFTSSIGDSKSVSLDFSCQIGGPEQTTVGVFMSGWYNEQGL